MEWQKIDLTTHQIAHGALDRLLNEFVHATLKPNISMDEVGVFANKQVDRKISLYFTPKATITLFSVIAPYNPSPCTPPAESEIDSLLFGEQSCWELLS